MDKPKTYLEERLEDPEFRKEYEREMLIFENDCLLADLRELVDRVHVQQHMFKTFVVDHSAFQGEKDQDLSKLLAHSEKVSEVLADFHSHVESLLFVRAAEQTDQRRTSG